MLSSRIISLRRWEKRPADRQVVAYPSLLEILGDDHSLDPQRLWMAPAESEVTGLRGHSTSGSAALLLFRPTPEIQRAFSL